MVREEAQLACGPVADRERVLGRYRQEGIVAGVDAHAVGQLLGEIRLRPPVPLDAEQLEPHAHAIADAVAIARREIAEQAATDLHALGAHADRLGHLERAVGAHDQLAAVIEDPLFRAQGPDREQQRQHQQTAEGPHRTGSSTGATRAPGSASKYSAGAKPKSFATITSGTFCTPSFRPRTAPL